MPNRKQKANNRDDESLKKHYLEMEVRSMHIAQTHEFVESLERFMLDAHKEPMARLPKLLTTRIV